MDNKKKTNLLDLARASENRIKNRVETTSVLIETSKEKEVIAEKSSPSQKKDDNFLDKYFVTSNDYGVGDLNIKIPISIHKKFKLIAAHTGVPMAKIVSNVLNEFLIENEKQIDNILKS